MSKKSSISITELTKRIFRKFGMTLFIIVITGGLIVSVLVLSDILLNKTAIGDSDTVTTTFDQPTIDKINKLVNNNNNINSQTPQSGRVNPFSDK